MLETLPREEETECKKIPSSPGIIVQFLVTIATHRGMNNFYGIGV